MAAVRMILRKYSTVISNAPVTVKSLYREIAKPPKQVENINGWIKSVRLLKKVAFIDLQDGTCSKTLKIAIPISHLDESNFLKTLNTGQSISISTAIWEATPQREQPFELKIPNPINNISIVGNVTASYPLQKKNHSLAFLRSLPTLKHRTTYLGSLQRFRSHVEYALSRFFHEEQFTKVSPPILTSNDCEGAGELFKVEATSSEGQISYFGKPAYLTVSTQLHLEILAMALSRCYTLTPCFRAEKSDTNRHLSEFWMLEAEMCFIDDVSVLTTLIESMIKQLVHSCYDNKDELIPSVAFQESLSKETILERWKSLLHPEPWKKITYTEAIDILQKKHQEKPFSKYEPKWGEPLQTEHEKWLAGDFFKAPVFVTDYPRNCKAFYMKLNKTEAVGKETVACFDLLVPDMGEIVGGSIREDDYNALVKEMERRDMNKSGDLDWYLSLRENGSVPHGGFGLGMERLISYLYGNHNIRDASPFHRSATGTIEL